MKHQIIIRPFTSTKGGRLNADRIKYIDGHEYACLKTLRAVRRDLLKPNDEPISQYVTNTSTTFTFNYDDSGGDVANKERKDMADILKYHSMMHMEGFKNPRQGAVTLFEMEDLAMNDVRNFNAELLILTAKNKSHQMSYQEKLDCYYFYGENPLTQNEDGYSTMDHRQLSLRLWAGDIGLVLRRVPFANTGKTYLEHFVKEYKKNDETYMLKTVILKSLILRGGDDKALLKKDGSAYLFGDDIIGSSVDECVAWLNNNPKRKEYLIKMVKETDTIGVDNLDEAMLEPENEVTTTKAMEAKVSDEALLKEAEELRVEYWFQNRKKPEKLLKDVEEARAIWKEARQLGLQSQIDSLKVINLKNIQKLIEKRKKQVLEAV